MCLAIPAIEVEKRRQDRRPRFVSPRPRVDEPIEVIEREVVREEEEDILIPGRSESTASRQRLLGEDPQVITIEPPTSPRSKARGDGCGVTIVVVEDGCRKRRRCEREHRCKRCQGRAAKSDAGSNRSSRRGRRRSEDVDHERHRCQEPPPLLRSPEPEERGANHQSLIEDLLRRISDLLRRQGDRDEEIRHLREELQREKHKEEQKERRLEKDADRLQGDIHRPVPPVPPEQHHHRHDEHEHQHLAHHAAGRRCPTCCPPRAPPSTPSVWQAPYGCPVPRGAIPDGKRTRKHHQNHGDRNRHNGGSAQRQRSASPSLSSAYTNGSSRSLGSLASVASRKLRQSFDRVRNYALRQGRRLKEVDAKVGEIGTRIDGLGVRVDDVGGRVEGMGIRVREVGSRLEGVGIMVEEVGGRVGEVDSRVSNTNARVEGVGIRVEELRDRADAVDARVEEMGDRVNNVRVQVGEVAEKTDVEGARVNVLSERMGILRGEVDELGRKERERDRYWPPDRAGNVPPIDVEHKTEIDVEIIEKQRRRRSRSRSRSRRRSKRRESRQGRYEHEDERRRSYVRRRPGA